MSELMLNIGSGQRPFNKRHWVNIDKQARWNPDVLCDFGNPLDKIQYEDGSYGTGVHCIAPWIGNGQVTVQGYNVTAGTATTGNIWACTATGGTTASVIAGLASVASVA